ncbi:MAG: hypothetical protein QGG88_11825 [Gammaproteobacteria bacterium]|jgi:GMP synthase-like glutamine amidotransferase|nr:hypothetical protein [Gammaproteobacteria bacterium]
MTKKLAIYLTNTDRSGWDKPYADYAVMTAQLLAPLLPAYSIELFDAVMGELPTVPEDYDGVVLTGSIANVTEQEPWMAELYKHIRRLDKAKVKLVGICFGHQAIAHALGGEVGPQVPQVGIEAVTMVQAPDWMQPRQSQVSLLCGNFQQVLSLPEGFQVLGTQGACAIPFYAKGEHILGCQYHPEFSTDYMHLYTDYVADKLGPECTDQARSQLQGHHDGALVGQWIANFVLA